MATKKTIPQASNFAFTDFSLSDKEEAFKNHEDEIRGLAWSEEACPNTGKAHHQGFIQTFKRARFKKVQALIEAPTAHIEVMKGSILDNQLYCEKEGIMKTLGEFVKPGRRTDLAEVAKRLSKGVAMKDIMETDVELYARNHRALEKIKGMYDKENRQVDRPITVTVLVGLSGTGKSHQVMALDDLFIVDAGASGDFVFDGYEGETNLLIDDFNGWIKYTFLLRILDKYRLSLNVKHGRTWANWDNVYITSNVRPSYWYSIGIDTSNLQRRITKIYEVVREGDQRGINIEQDSMWAWDKLRQTPYEGNAYG